MLSCVSCAACSLALSLRAAMLDARLSAAAVAGSASAPEATAPSTAGVGCLRSAAAVDALVRGAMVEKSLWGEQTARSRPHELSAASRGSDSRHLSPGARVEEQGAAGGIRAPSGAPDGTRQSLNCGRLVVLPEPRTPQEKKAQRIRHPWRTNSEGGPAAQIKRPQCVDSGLSVKKVCVPRSVPGVMLVGEQVVEDRRDKRKKKNTEKEKLMREGCRKKARNCPRPTLQTPWGSRVRASFCPEKCWLAEPPSGAQLNCQRRRGCWAPAC